MLLLAKDKNTISSSTGKFARLVQMHHGRDDKGELLATLRSKIMSNDQVPEPRSSEKRAAQDKDDEAHESSEYESFEDEFGDPMEDQQKLQSMSTDVKDKQIVQVE